MSEKYISITDAIHGCCNVLHNMGKCHIGVLCPDFGCREVREVFEAIPAADVIPRDEGIKLGAELAAMHGSDATSKDLEKSYWNGFEDAMKKRDVQAIKHGEWRWDENGMDWGLGAWRCSECGAKPETWWEADRKYNPLRCAGGKFCSNCGAYMRGKKDA